MGWFSPYLESIIVAVNNNSNLPRINALLSKVEGMSIWINIHDDTTYLLRCKNRKLSSAEGIPQPINSKFIRTDRETAERLLYDRDFSASLIISGKVKTDLGMDDARLLSTFLSLAEDLL
jgi:hypothetical protein